MKSWVEVSEERLQTNYRAVQAAAGAETDVLAVVKANAYGHGAERCAAALVRAGATWLGVADVQEGARVRRAVGAEPEILVMCGILQDETEALAEHRLTPVVWTAEQVGWLRGLAGVRPHVEIETGMGRQGARPGAELQSVLDAMAEAGAALDGVMTHFCAAEVAGSAKTREQQRLFAVAVAQVREMGIRPGWVHAGSSSSVDQPTADAGWLEELAKTMGTRAMVRCGIALYGYCLPIEGGAGKLREALKPVMTWKARVIDVREVAAGESVGYNATFTARTPMRVALLPVGYSDGLRRELGGADKRKGGWVMIGGQRAAIVGRVSMNLTTVDVTEIEGVKVGDEVVVLGDGVTADDHARLAGTISYEVLCGVKNGG